MADNCNDRVAPTITPPDVPDIDPCNAPTKEELLEILGYQEILLSKSDSEGFANVVVPGVAVTGG